MIIGDDFSVVMIFVDDGSRGDDVL